jgi:hypothetical protein
LANAYGDFVDRAYDSPWCSSLSSTLHVADFDGDGLDDLLCDDSSTGAKTFEFGTTTGTLAPVYRALYWCTGADVELHTGDFNGDGRADLLCSRNTDGYKWFAFADAFGRFSTTNPLNYEINMQWCYNGDELYVADFDGDHRSDLLCHNPTDGFTWFAYADMSGHFHSTDKTKSEVCFHGDATLLVGDVNNDGKSELVCHKGGSNEIWFGVERTGVPYPAHSSAEPFCTASPHHVIAGRRGGRLTLLCDLNDPTSPRRKSYLSSVF